MDAINFLVWLERDGKGGAHPVQAYSECAAAEIFTDRHLQHLCDAGEYPIILVVEVETKYGVGKSWRMRVRYEQQRSYDAEKILDGEED